MKTLVCLKMSMMTLTLLPMVTSELTSVLCPWQRYDLIHWSDAGTWGAKDFPREDEEVILETGMNVLLDISPPPLRSITIRPGAQLVWAHKDDLVLKTGHILVEGQFHVGQDTPKCRMTAKARIVLQGQSDSPVQAEVVVAGSKHVHTVKKAIVVAPGGVLEIHGADQKSWTKLTHTLPSVDNMCSILFDIAHKDSPYPKRDLSGLHVTSWNPDGSLFDFNMFDASTMLTQLSAYLEALPDGTIVAMAVKDTIGDPDTGNWEPAYLAMEELGSRLIRNVSKQEAYSFIAVKGVRDTVDEAVTRSGTGVDGEWLEGPFVTFTDWDRRLEFSARSIVHLTVARRNVADFKIFNTDVVYPVLKLKDDVTSWNVDDQIVVASTDFDWRQAEVRTIVDCRGLCQANQVRVKGAFHYMHYGEISHGVDERAEVMLLSRSVVVEGEMEDQCYDPTAPSDLNLCDKFGVDTYGGHIKAFKGHVGFHVQHAELFHMGQQAHLGSYPLHFHMCDNATGSWVKSNSIHHSFSRCVTVHGTDYAQIIDNACYYHLGHGYFLEDSAEQNNVFRGNLGIGTQHGTLIMSDKARHWCGNVYPNTFCDGLATFWISHPNNVFEDNVAAGSDNTGFMFTYADEPLGPSKKVQAAKADGVKFQSTRFTPFKRFYNNVAHSNKKFGVMAEGRISIGENSSGVHAPPNAFLLEADNFYDPRIPNTRDGVPTTSTIERMTVYKNRDTNLWLRGGNIRLVQSTSADAPVGLYPAHSVPNTSVETYDSLFVGETENLGCPFLYRNRSQVYTDDAYPEHSFNRSFAQHPGYSLTAVSFANGPVIMANCYFDRFFNWFWNDTFQQTWGYRPIRPGGALSFRRRNRYRAMPYNGVWDMKFGFCDNVAGGNWVLNRDEVEEWHMMDGNLQNQFRDYDGSVTGQPGTQIVRNFPVYTGLECVWHPSWNMAACPYSYAKVLINGKTGVLETKGDLIYPVILRDDVHEHPFALQGHKNIEFLMVKNRSYTITFNGTIPDDFFLKGINMEQGDVIRIGVCLPVTTTRVKIRSRYVSLTKDSHIVWVNNTDQLDSDDTGRAIFWHRPSNMLFFKLLSWERRQHWEECPGNKCPTVEVWLLDGDRDTRDCSSYRWTAFNDGLVPPKPVQPQCSRPASPEGLGALRDDDVTPRAVYWPTCDQLNSPYSSVHVVGSYEGCFKDVKTARAVDKVEQILSSMTVQQCLDRCSRFGFTMAALQKGTECRCGQAEGEEFRKYLQVAETKCNFLCDGGDGKTCGGRMANSVWLVDDAQLSARGAWDSWKYQAGTGVG